MAAPSEGDAASLLPDLPGGPLQAYRTRASFCWKELALFLEGEDMLRLKVRLQAARRASGSWAQGAVRPLRTLNTLAGPRPGPCPRRPPPPRANTGWLSF